MSYPRKRHASMMESQKKAAEAAEAESMLAAAASTPSSSSSAAAVAASEQGSVHAPASASIQHEDFNDDSSSDDDDNGIAFLSAAVGATKKGKAAPKGKAGGAAASGGSRAGNNSTAAAAAAVMSLQRMHWTKEMDALLLHVVPIYDGKDWVSIAKHMGGDVTNEQCRNRWCSKVDPSLHTCKMGNWESDEEEQLRTLILQFTNHPEQDKRGRRRYKDSVHWGAVAKELNRSQKDCRSKWTTLQRSVSIQEMKKGPFTPEEDIIVMQRVAEWGDKGQGIWKSLELELGRPSNNIGNRYRKLLKTHSTSTTENGVVVTPLNVTSYLPSENERKLAAALAPVQSASSSQVPDSAFLEAATAAAVLAGKKRGRPRTNPLPISLVHSSGLGSSDSSVDGMPSGQRGKRHRADLLESLATLSQAGSIPTVPSSMPANVPINASAEVAAGRTKIGRSSFWNEERDALLVEAMTQFGKDWNAVSAHVGEGANSDRCWQRWNRYLKPDAMVCKTDPWTTDELIKLEELVLTHTNNPDKRRAGRSTSRASIDWTTISQLMERPYMDCKGKWKKIRAFNMKKGPFTTEEDALILQRVAELGLDQHSAADDAAASSSSSAADAQQTVVYPNGLWEELSNLLNRPPEIVRARVRSLRNKGISLV